MPSARAYYLALDSDSEFLQTDPPSLDLARGYFECDVQLTTTVVCRNPAARSIRGLCGPSPCEYEQNLITRDPQGVKPADFAHQFHASEYAFVETLRTLEIRDVDRGLQNT